MHVEQELMRERVGVQDQTSARLAASGTCAARPTVPCAPSRCRWRRSLDGAAVALLLLYTGIRRHAHDVLAEQIDNTRSGAVTGALGRMRTLVDEGFACCGRPRPLTDFGELLNTAWTLKRTLSPRVSSDRIDGWYDQARAEGAIGGKLLGAGGGGFLLLLVPPEQQDALLRPCRICAVPFEFDARGIR